MSEFQTSNQTSNTYTAQTTGSATYTYKLKSYEGYSLYDEGYYNEFKYGSNDSNYTKYKFN